MHLTRPLHATVVGGLAVVLLGAPAGAGVAAYRTDVASRGVLPAGSLVGGVDVASLDRAAAITAVRARFTPEESRPATLRVGEREFSVTPRELGVTYDVEQAVDEAFRRASEGSWISRSWERLRNDRPAPNVPVAVTAPDEERMREFVRGVASEVQVAAKDAAVRQAGGWLEFTRATAGARLDEDAALTALREALEDGTVQELGLLPITPKVPDSAYETVILVRAGENKLYLYKNGKVARTYGVATGSARYATPTGRFEVTLKRYRPTWVNPWSRWSMNMPARIGPGPNNPLGTRALNISAPGIRIHGTPAANSIGYSVSHGCIRMRMPDVEALYEQVPTGTTVFIVQAGPHRPMGSRVASPADVAAGG